MPELVLPASASAPDWSGPVRQLERVILDPITEDVRNAPLELTGRDAGHGLYLVDHSYPPGERKRSWAGSSETIGELPIGLGLPSNRQIPITVWASEEEGLGQSTNLATNPKCGVDTTGYGVTGGLTISRVIFTSRSALGITIPYPKGLAAETGLYMTNPGAPTSGGGNRARITFAVAGSQIVTASAWIYIGTLGGATGFTIDIRTDVGDTLLAASPTYSVVGAWQRVSTSFLLPAAGNYRAAFRQIGNGNPVGVMTGLMIESSDSLNPYFDGDTPGCDWNATRHASISLREPAGGKRFTAALADLEQKLEKLAAEGGTLKRVLPSGDELIFDVVDANGLGTWAKEFNQSRVEQQFTLVAKPYARGQEVTLDDHTGQGVVIGTDTVSLASTRSGGRIQIDDDGGTDRRYVIWGGQSKTYDADPDGLSDLFYEAESLSLLGTTTSGALAGASGGSVAKQDSLTRQWVAILQTTNPTTFGELRHVGSYKVIARLYLPATNAGKVKVALRWSVDEFQTHAQNEPISYKLTEARAGGFVLADLGAVELPVDADGTRGRWRGTLVGKSSNIGDGVYVDYIALVPLEVSGELRIGAPALDAPTTYKSRDEFFQAAGAIDGKALPIGGNWNQSGTTGGEDWSTSGSGGNVHIGTSNDNPSETGGTFLWDGSASQDLITVQADVWLDFNQEIVGGTFSRLGVMARYVDTNNYLYAVIRPGADGWAELRLYKAVAGTIALIESGYDVCRNSELGQFWRTIRLYVDANGRYYVWYGVGAAAGVALTEDTSDVTTPGFDLIYQGRSNSLATGGALASGHSGVFGSQRDANPTGLVVANFYAYKGRVDAAIYANQSMEIRDSVVRRENLSGSVWYEKPEYRGDYFLVPPSGREKRTLRTIVIASPDDPDSGNDAPKAAQSHRIHLVPYYVVVPEPA